MFGSLPGGVPSQQELFISPLDSMASHSSMPPAPMHAFPHHQSTTPPVPSSTYSGSPAPSDFSFPVQAPQSLRSFDVTHTQGMPMSHAKNNVVGLDADMSAYSQISEQLFADAIQEQQQQQQIQQQQQQQQQMPIVAPIAMPVDATGFNFNDVINDF